MKVSIDLPQKRIDEATKKRIKELENENRDLKDSLQRVFEKAKCISSMTERFAAEDNNG